LGRIVVDCSFKLRRLSGWSSVIERNEWFEKWTAREVLRLRSAHVFSYSYTARLAFRVAKSVGGQCILGQIDPGPREEDLVEEQTSAYRHLAPPADRAPETFWRHWREEIELADKIMVNSSWSAKLLVEAGVPSQKLVEIPLAYELPESSVSSGQLAVEEDRKAERQKGGKGDRLQALFLGSVILRKGVGQLFDAIKMLKNEPVDFTFAGPVGVKIPDEISGMSNVRFLGPVDKAATERLYREADVFLFPTLSDGFGLTQLEALGHGLPVLVSKNCGQVVEDQISGQVLPEVTPNAIAGGIMELVSDRSLLAKLKSGARVPDKFHPKHLAAALIDLEND
jgi:glycosyltransferase involved in cell wall biosynthesis